MQNSPLGDKESLRQELARREFVGQEINSPRITSPIGAREGHSALLFHVTPVI
jgi:hypothetical protein